VAGSCERGDEPPGSGPTELVALNYVLQFAFHSPRWSLSVNIPTILYSSDSFVS
jgi:hypothetical protein